MKKIILIIALISIFYCIKAQNIQEDSINYSKDIYSYNPQYMGNIYTDNLWFNQPVKEVMRYNAITGSLLCGIIAYEKGDTEILMYTFFGAPVGATLTGVGIGLMKAFYYDKLSSKSRPTFRKPKFFIENAISLNDYTSFSTKLVYKNNFLFFNEIGLKYSGTEYGISGISSVQIELTNYIVEKNFLKLYYDISAGSSSAVFKSQQGYSILKEFKYDFCGSLQAGLKLNLMDFAYFKFSANYLYSPNLDEIINKYQNIDESIKSNFSIAIGSDLFWIKIKYSG